MMPDTMMPNAQTRLDRSPQEWCSSTTSVLCLLLAATCGGCVGGSTGAGPRPEVLDRVGRTYYIDGAGNWGYGVTEVREGLRRAGYKGNIINYRWSPTFNPALDQTIGRAAARARGVALGKEITSYLTRRPDNKVNIIALSAGTGVAVWACENLKPPARVNTLILLGSSLSAHYDMREALANVSGGVWVYFSPNDQILNGPVRALGTIDGRMIADSAGLVGLHPPHGDDGKIHNIGWAARWGRYGWSGAHTDATSEPFVQNVLARHILPLMSQETVALPPASTPPAEISCEANGTADTCTGPQEAHPAAQPVAHAATCAQ
jgi:hypothetical protein